MDYETLIILAVKIEQQVKEEQSKVYEPVQFFDIVKNSKILAMREVLQTIYTEAREAKDNG